jgi:3-hydroxyacyl-[acyl-carrier-protein] dehydratase
MCECAAQLCSYYFKRVTQTGKFLGFGGMDGVKFRGQVQPGDTLVVVASTVKIAQRMAIFECQGFVDHKMVFQGKITGMPM